MENSNPGFNCPVCGFQIEVSLKELLLDQKISCPSCLTELKMNTGTSNEAQEALQKFQQLKDNLDPPQE